jgi:hypothetical protein
LILRPIPVQVHTVAIRVAKIEGLAYSVIGGAVKRHAGIQQSLQRTCQLPASRVQNREMIQAGVSGRRSGTTAALPGIQSDVMVIATRR